MKEKAVLAKLVDSCTIKPEDTQLLQKTSAAVSAMEDLIKRNIVNDAIFERHAAAYLEFGQAWDKILKTYFPGKDYNPVGGNYNWNCDFNTNLVTITI